MINFLWMCVILFETGIPAVRAIPVQCAMSNNKVSEAGNWPDTVGTYHNDLDWTELRYYRLRCEFSSNPRTFPRGDLFRVYHDHWRRPFERADCERAGCIPVIWKSNSSFSNSQPIIDVYWSNVIQFATTAPQLKVCQINAANQSIIAFTTSQLNDLSVCQPSGRFNVSGNVAILIYTFVGPSNDNNTTVTVKDFFMHVSSDMFTEQEIERVNNGENVIVTIDKDCSAGYKFRDGCDIMLLASPYSSCDVFIRSHYYTARLNDGGLELTEIFDKTNGLIAYKYRMTTYKLYYGVYSHLTEGRFVIRQNMISHKPVDFVLSCMNSKLYTPFRDKIVKRFTLITLYWPNTTIDIRSADRINEHFLIGKGQEAVFDVRIVTSNNVTAFQVKALEGDLNEGEVVIKPKVYYPYNYTTLYSIIILPRSNHESYRIVYRVQEINVELTTLFYLTTKREIEMAVNPMKIVVVRGDRSVQPYFICAATSFPVDLTLVWSKEIGALQAKQSPVEREILPPAIARAAYLKFPPATALTSEYSGEYTCTASSPSLIASKKITAILVVLEPGSYYSLFQPHWIPTDLEEPGDIIVTNQEKAYFDCIDQPIITEPGKLSCTHSTREDSTTTVVQTMIGLSTSIMAVATISLGVVLSYRWYKKHMRIPDDASSEGEALITTSSNEASAESTVDNEEDSDWGL